MTLIHWAVLMCYAIKVSPDRYKFDVIQKQQTFKLTKKSKAVSGAH